VRIFAGDFQKYTDHRKTQFVMQTSSSAAFADTKPHYELLDGLRGVAALLVVVYHVFEGFSFAQGGTVIRTLNHGYLAVDFFFMLSGFVLGYAYDERWQPDYAGRGGRLTVGAFFKRRLIRLHPMALAGAVIGCATFLWQGSVTWDGASVPVPAVLLSLLCAVLFIPAAPGSCYEVRGNGEMFPLNGPSWSLFFEYIGNVVYALLLRRLSTRWLAVLTGLLAAGLAWFTCGDAVGYGMFGVGWTLEGVNFPGGLLRLLFPFSAGLLLSRLFRPVRLRCAFWLCSAALLVLFAVPFVEGGGGLCLNGLYETVCIVCLFPLIIWAGASGRTTDGFSSRTCKLLGDLSFPLYIIHYPFMYLFYAWLLDGQRHTLGQTWSVVLVLCFGTVLLAYLLLRCYDEPVRKWLAGKFLRKKG